MRFRTLTFFWLLVSLIAGSCGSGDAPTQEGATTTLQSAGGGDPLTGTWTGDYGPNARDRNPVTLELNWDGTNLTGTVNPGPDAVEIQQTGFNPATSEVHLEADAQGLGGVALHYVIDGTVNGNTMTGTWNHSNGMGDFTLTR